MEKEEKEVHVIERRLADQEFEIGMVYESELKTYKAST